MRIAWVCGTFQEAVWWVVGAWWRQQICSMSGDVGDTTVGLAPFWNDLSWTSVSQLVCKLTHMKFCWSKNIPHATKTTKNYSQLNPHIKYISQKRYGYAFGCRIWTSVNQDVLRWRQGFWRCLNVVSIVNRHHVTPWTNTKHLIRLCDVYQEG